MQTKIIQTKNIDRKYNVQWAPLNGITDNGINRLMGSNLSHLSNPKILFPTFCMVSSLAYQNQSVIGISLSLSQSDPIKRRPLYSDKNNIDRHKDRHTQRQTYTKIDIHKDRHTQRQTYTNIDIRKDRQTKLHTQR